KARVAERDSGRAFLKDFCAPRIWPAMKQLFDHLLKRHAQRLRLMSDLSLISVRYCKNTGYATHRFNYGEGSRSFLFLQNGNQESSHPEFVSHQAAQTVWNHLQNALFNAPSRQRHNLRLAAVNGDSFNCEKLG